MIATFYNLNKKENSTKQPTGAGTQLEVRFKDSTDVDNPRLLVKTNVMSYNYMSINGSYYFINKKTYVANELFEIEAKCDALATCKSAITASTQYVVRTDTQSNQYIFDSAYPLESDPHVNKSEQNIFSWNNPCYLLTVKGKGGSIIYLTNKGSVNLLANTFYSMTQKNIWDAIGQTPSLFQETYFDPFSFIVDLRMIPITFNPNTMGGVTEIDLGPLHFSDVASSFKDVTDLNIISNTKTYDLVYRTSDDKEYLRSNKSRTMVVYLPGCGEISHDCDKAWNATQVVVNYIVDCRGHVAYKSVMGNDIQSMSSDVSVPVALYSNIANVGGVLSGVSKIVGATVAGASVGGTAGAIGGFATGAISALSSAQPLYKGSSIGSDGSRASTYLMPDIIFTETQYDIPTMAPAILGKPLCKSITLSTNGFYLIEQPRVDFGNDLYIKNEIIEHMKTGFYVE